MKTYNVQSGDTLFSIAQHEYGDGNLYPVIARQNHLADPNVINIGQPLELPYVTFRHHFSTPDSPATRQAITQQYYGTADPGKQLIWEIINGVAQRPIHEGSWLHIPDLLNPGHHTVVTGDNLHELAFRWYGDDHLRLMLAHANNLPHNATLALGQVLIRPGLNRFARTAGDTLRSLCEAEYGSANLDTWIGVVAAANFISAPDSLFANQVVYFPR
ncbi:UNVERIFIED_CONTAM: LysM domain-containing protein [Williamsia faeni]